MAQLDFGSSDTLFATHGLHPYAAKCPPQLVNYGLRYYTQRGDTVLDPMVGSGTTLVQARLLGRNAIGFDIDPLACLIASVKCTEIDPDEALRAGCRVLKAARLDLSEAAEGPCWPDCPNADYWFTQTVASELAALRRSIQLARVSPRIRAFLWVCFSSLIMAKESVANARDIIHSRHHHRVHTKIPDVLARFETRLNRMAAAAARFVPLLTGHSTTASVHRGDARRLPLDPESIDLVFTSPPYATALDYQRSHFLSMAWLTSALHFTYEEYKSLRPKYIGTAKAAAARVSTNSNIADPVVDAIRNRCPLQAKTISRYFDDMQVVLREIARVLKCGRHAIIVVCPSHIRRIAVPTDEILTQLGVAEGLRTVRRHERYIDGSKRVLPFQRGGFRGRMHKEYVLIMKKS
jgi:hypothetical protein